MQIINSLLRSSREGNTMKHINTILSSIKTHYSVFSGTYLISSTFIDFRILNNYNDAIINFIFFPITFWLGIIPEICLQIRTKNMQIMECFKNYQLRKTLAIIIFIFFPVIFWLSIITEICLQIRTKNMQIMECFKNYQLRKNLGNNIFLYYSFLFDSLFPIKSQIIW